MNTNYKEKDMIYLDNASTTLKKPVSVYVGVIKAMLKYNANPGRSGHSLSLKAGLEVYDTRELIAKHFNGKSENVIFTSGCTEALNLAIRGTAKAGGHIIATAYEHNSVLRVLEALKQDGKITYTIIYPDKNKKIDVNSIKKAINKDTYAIITNHISNVLGIEQDIKSIGKLAKNHNLIYIVDTAQSAGHKHIDMQECKISLLAFAGHKGLLGLSGVGGLVVNDGVKLSPIKYGGTGTKSESLAQPTEIPEGFECGTLPFLNIVALKYGIQYINKHFDKINSKIEELTAFLLENLSNMDNITLYTPLNSLNGVVAFNVKNYEASRVSDILNAKYKICVRSGLACAPLVSKYLGINKNGVVRVSISHYNSKNDIKSLLKALKTIK